MQIHVMSRKRAIAYSYSKHESKSIIISISDVNAKRPVFKRNSTNRIRAIYPVRFEDATEGEFIMTEEQAAGIHDFIMRHRDSVDCIIVHCEAGISRSAGIAMALNLFINNSTIDTFKSPPYVPNMHCYSLIVQAFCQNHNLMKRWSFATS